MIDQPIVFLNQAFMPISEAKVSVLDRGFIFGDGIYEVIPIYNGKPFCAKQHLARLSRSLLSVEISNPYDFSQWCALIAQVVEKNGTHDQMVYIQVTRGVAKRAHAFPADTKPTVFIMSNPLHLPSAQVRAVGVACVTLEDRRWLHCDIKSTSLLGNVLAAQYATEHQAVEAIQFRDGLLTEASASNVWVVKQGQLIAPPRDHLILEGIRYGLIEQLCTANDIELSIRSITRAEVFDADEIMLSSASKEILPVVTLDGVSIGAGIPGPIYAKLYAAYQQAKIGSADLHNPAIA